MSNKHIKTINGRRYYYESVRRGKKVTSRYLGPVDARVKKERRKKETGAVAGAPQQEKQEEASYIG